MLPLTEARIRGSIANCTRGEANRMKLPSGLSDLDWPGLDLLGWRDPKAPQRAYLVTEDGDGPVGLALRVADSPGARTGGVCGLCRSVRRHGDISLFTARRTGASGARGDSVGLYICADLSCSRNARMEKATVDIRPDGTLTPEQRVAGLRERLSTFVAGVLSSA